MPYINPMKTDGVKLTLNVKGETKKMLRELAEKTNRSLTGMVEELVGQAYHGVTFNDGPAPGKSQATPAAPARPAGSTAVSYRDQIKAARRASAPPRGTVASRKKKW